MKTKHLKGMTASALTVSHLALTNSSVVFATNGGQVQSKLVQVANTIRSILTGLVALAGICVALFIIIKRMSDTDDLRERSEAYHAVGRIAGSVTLAAVAIWLLSWVYSLFTWN